METTIKPISGAAARRYLEEWMNLRAVSSFMRTEDHLYCTAADRMSSVNGKNVYRIERKADSFQQYNVYQRPVNILSADEKKLLDHISQGLSVEWEWVDAIPAQEMTPSEYLQSVGYENGSTTK